EKSCLIHIVETFERVAVALLVQHRHGIRNGSVVSRSSFTFEQSLAKAVSFLKPRKPAVRKLQRVGDPKPFSKQLRLFDKQVISENCTMLVIDNELSESELKCRMRCRSVTLRSRVNDVFVDFLMSRAINPRSRRGTDSQSVLMLDVSNNVTV